jgi:hypothetical protein
VQKGWPAGRDLHYLEAHDAHHSESAWAARVAALLEFLYPVTASS